MAGKRVWNTDLLTLNAGSPAEYARLFDEITSALTTVCGLVQTADTGQLDSGSPPSLSNTLSSNQLFGYRIFRFNDALQADRPIFLRIEFRYVVKSSEATSRLPYFTLQIGQGSDGAGNLTSPGAAYARPFNWGASSWTATTVMPLGSYPSFACGGEGFAWLAFKVGAIPVLDQTEQPWSPRSGAKRHMFSLAIMRSTDADGNPTAEGFITHFGGAMYQNSSSIYWTSGATDETTEVRGSFGLQECTDFLYAPMLKNFQTSGGKPILGRLATPFSGLPATPFMGVASIALTNGDTFSAALVGASERTYLYPGDSLARMPYSPNNLRPWSAPFFLWEGPDL